MDQLHDQNRLTYTCTSEQTDLTALCIRTDQVYDLDTGLEDLRCRSLLLVGRCLTMNRPTLLCLRSRHIIYRITQKVKYSSQTLLADRNRDRISRIHSIRSANQTVGRVHSDATHHIVADLLGYFGHNAVTVHLNLNRVQQCRQFTLCKPDIQYRAGYLHYLANMFLTHIRISLLSSRFLRARNNLRNLLRDAGLTRPVVIKVQLFDHLSRILRRCIHCRSTSRKLTGY